MLAPSLARGIRTPAGCWSLLRRLAAVLLFALAVGVISIPQAADATDATVLVLEVVGPIGPATVDFVVGEIEGAESRQLPLVVLMMDTPGGLDSSMRDIIRAILGSSVPVATYVAPAGARAASAGTYILYASHVAAMAPATNLGAATPVQIGGLPGMPESEPPQQDEDQKPEDSAEKPAPTDESPAEPEVERDDGAPESSGGKTAMERKLVNDARAYIRSLAQLRGRNAEWAERAVTEAASLTADEALKIGVIDVVASSPSDLLTQIDGTEVRTAAGTVVLATADASAEMVEPDWRNRILALITNPQIAYVLMLLGVYGLFFELSNPGAIVPGVLGGICLLLALFAFQVLPVNYAGLALVGLGLAFMIGEVFMPSFGALGIGGVVAFVVGSLMLWRETGPGYEVPMALIVGFALASAFGILLIGRLFARQRRRPVVSGSEELAGATGIAAEDIVDQGWVRVHGESWRAHTVSPVSKDTKVRVVGRQGLTLEVEPDEGRSK